MVQIGEVCSKVRYGRSAQVRIGKVWVQCLRDSFPTPLIRARMPPLRPASSEANDSTSPALWVGDGEPSGSSEPRGNTVSERVESIPSRPGDHLGEALHALDTQVNTARRPIHSDVGLGLQDVGWRDIRVGHIISQSIHK